MFGVNSDDGLYAFLRFLGRFDADTSWSGLGSEKLLFRSGMIEGAAAVIGMTSARLEELVAGNEKYAGQFCTRCGHRSCATNCKELVLRSLPKPLKLSPP